MIPIKLVYRSGKSIIIRVPETMLKAKFYGRNDKVFQYDGVDQRLMHTFREIGEEYRRELRRRITEVN